MPDIIERDWYPDPPPPELLTTEEFLALSHLDEQPVRTAEDVAAMVQDYIANLGTHLAITGYPESHDIVMDSGFAEKIPGSDTEIVPELSVVPFYQYTVRNTATDTTGAVIASGDRRIGSIIAYIEDTADNSETAPFMEIFIDNLNAYVKTTIETYNNVTPEEIEAAVQRGRDIVEDPLRVPNKARLHGNSPLKSTGPSSSAPGRIV